MITSIVTFLSARFVAVFVTTIVVVVTVPSLIIAIHGNTITITTVASGARASGVRNHCDDECNRIIIKVKTAGDDVIVKINNEEASCDAQLAALASQSKLSPSATQAAIAHGEAEIHAATATFVREIKDDEDEFEHAKVVSTKTETVILTRISQVKVVALGENGTQGAVVTICQIVIVEVTQTIVTVVVQGGDGDNDTDVRFLAA